MRDHRRCCSDAPPRGRPRREALTLLQFAEASSLAMWCFPHRQEVCSAAGPAMEGGAYRASGGDGGRSLQSQRSQGEPFPTRRRRRHRHGCLRHRCRRRSLCSGYRNSRILSGGLWEQQSREANRVNSFHVPEFPQFLHKRTILRIDEALAIS